MYKLTTKYIGLTLMALLFTACATTSGYWQSPSGVEVNRQKDDLECWAIASQAAQGAGGWSSDPAMRAAIYDNAKQQYFNQCARSRGYTWVTSR